VSTVRSECLDWTLISSDRQLYRVLTEYLRYGTTTQYDHTEAWTCNRHVRLCACRKLGRRRDQPVLTENLTLTTNS
jgi:hypothetical protein